ncbi:MAG: helix-turn-helix domain-containing protein [Sphingomonadaceae bacterium]|nr:helix-turn-helix domain-containing protein [Sphingomonadaceae bacterium]
MHEITAKQTLGRLGIAQPTFYRWPNLYQRFGEDALEDRRPGPRQAWNRIPEKVQGQILAMALERCDLSPRELAVTFTDERRYFVSEASVYRLLKRRDLITSPNFIVMKAASELKDKTTAPIQLWQTECLRPSRNFSHGMQLAMTNMSHRSYGACVGRSPVNELVDE